MSISKPKLWFTATIVLGILTSFLAVNYLRGIEEAATREVAAQEKTVPAVVAAQKIPQGTKVGADMVKTIQVPEKYAPSNAYTDPKEVVSRFAEVDLWPEEIIIPQKLTNENKTGDLQYKIPEGNRAITIAVNSITGVAGLIKPGHYIDILLKYQASDRPEDDKVVTFLQNVAVLAVGTDLMKKEEAQASDNITIAVTPEEAQLVMMAESSGKVKLVLRPAGDEDKVDLKSFSAKDLQVKYP